MNASAVVVHRAIRDESTSHFVRHFLEMVVAMIVGMAVLGALVSLIFRLLGHANLLHYTGLRGAAHDHVHDRGHVAVDASSRTQLGRHHRDVRGDGPPTRPTHRPVLSGAAIPQTLLVAMHALMLPFMLVAMLLRRNEYAQDHRHHADGAEPSHNGHQGSSEPRSAPFPRSFATFNRKVANPVMRKIAGSFGPFAIVRHRGPGPGGTMQRRFWLLAPKTDSWSASCTAPRRTG